MTLLRKSQGGRLRRLQGKKSESRVKKCVVALVRWETSVSFMYVVWVTLSSTDFREGLAYCCMSTVLYCIDSYIGLVC